MNGALPPSSIDVRLTVSAHRRWSVLPTSVEPVKLSLGAGGTPTRLRPSPRRRYDVQHPGRGQTRALGERDEGQGAERRLFGGV